jgi:hypothetical protein
LGAASVRVCSGSHLRCPASRRTGSPVIRAHDGGFALVLVRRRSCRSLHAPRRHPVAREQRARVERIAASRRSSSRHRARGGIAFASHIWRDFTNPASAQLANSPSHPQRELSNRWTCGRGLARSPGIRSAAPAPGRSLTDRMLRRADHAEEPHSVPLSSWAARSRRLPPLPRPRRRGAPRRRALAR